jgi:hypothetical protein
VRNLGHSASAVSVASIKLPVKNLLSLVGNFAIASSLSLRNQITASVGGSDNLGLSLVGFTSLASSISLRALFGLGSALSISSNVGAVINKSFSIVYGIAVGSSVSIRGTSMIRSIGNSSLISYHTLGSSLSVRDIAAQACGASVLCFLNLASAFSLRGAGKGCTSLSLGFDQVSKPFTQALSLLDTYCLGSSLSLRLFSRESNKLSILQFVDLGSTLTLRNRALHNSGLSVLSSSMLRATLVESIRFSVLNECDVGSSLSVRNLCRLGSYLTMLNYALEGSSLSLRSITGFGSNCSIASVSRFDAHVSIYASGPSSSSLLSLGIARGYAVNIRWVVSAD